jgi:hypothetical protein
LIVIVTTLIGAANTAFPSAPAFAIYYMAVDGNDSYDGLAAAHTTGIHGPWLTPNHAVNCGDVIYAEPGIYNSSARLWNISTTVSNCPSENNIYAAQIICKDAFSCSTSSSGNGYSAVKIVASNIALQGWVLSSFHPDAACAAINPQSNTILHHVAFVNNICNGAFAEGFGSYPRAAFYGVDYQAYVGNIAYNAAKGADFCYSGFSVYEPVNYDSLPGTHVFVYGNISYGNTGTSCYAGLNSDHNGIIFDDWGGSQKRQAAYTGSGVIKNNITFDNYGSGIAVGGNGTSAAAIKIYNNTLAYNSRNTLSKYGIPELLLNSVTGSAPVKVFNNIIQADVYSYTVTGSQDAGATRYVYAVQSYNTTNIATVNDNYIYNVASVLGSTLNNTPKWPHFTFGSNTNADANFVSAPAHGAIAAPNCTGFSTAIGCLATVVSDFKSKVAPTYGYQSPGDCAPDSDYPDWLKGLVPDGLVQKPCGL